MTQLSQPQAVVFTGRRLVLPVVAVGVLLSALDLFIVNVALPHIARDLGVADLADLSWVLNGYTIAYAAVLVPAGRVSDRVGSKKTFIGGLLIFVLASGGCAGSQSLAALVAFRVVQAAGAALMIPSSLGLVLAVTPPAGRAGAVRTWAGLGAIGAALGPALGGILVVAHWQWVFLINVPLGVMALIAAARLLPSPSAHPGLLPGFAHSVVLTVTVAALVTALVNGERWGWTSLTTFGFAATTVVGGALTSMLVTRATAPIIEAELLRVGAFVPAAVYLLVFHVAFGAMLLSIVLWTEQAWGWSPLQTGLGIAPGPLLVPFVAGLIGRVAPQRGPQAVSGSGAAIFAVGIAWWAVFATTEPNYVFGILPGMMLTGIGVGLALPAAMALGTSNLPPQRFATGSAVLSMSRQIGIAVGVAAFIAMIGGSAGNASLSSFQRAWWLTAAFSLGALVPTFYSRTRRPT